MVEQIKNGISGPWWSDLIKTVGPTTLISLGLVWWLTQSLNPVLLKMNDFMLQHAKQTEELETAETVGHMGIIGRLQALSVEARADRQLILAFEFQLCVDSAKSPYQVNKCDELMQRDSKERDDQK